MATKNKISKERFNITVSIPIFMPIEPTGKMEIGEQVDLFTRYRDQSVFHEERASFDLCRTLLKWAGACNARLEDIERSANSNTLLFDFGFEVLEDLVNFSNTIDSTVFRTVAAAS